ncbi:MAG: hypothetical protein C0458_08055 [Methylobacterium sp.]|nr:hypothetical protein [Methylobacterium sp.]
MRNVRYIPISETLWSAWYAWRPVFPIDDHGAFWLEEIWRRRHPETGQHEHRSFRTETAKLQELTARFF